MCTTTGILAVESQCDLCVCVCRLACANFFLPVFHAYFTFISVYQFFVLIRILLKRHLLANASEKKLVPCSGKSQLNAAQIQLQI